MITYFGIYLVYNLEHFGIFYSAKPGNPAAHVGRVITPRKTFSTNIIEGAPSAPINIFAKNSKSVVFSFVVQTGYLLAAGWISLQKVTELTFITYSEQ